MNWHDLRRMELVLGDHPEKKRLKDMLDLGWCTDKEYYEEITELHDDVIERAGVRPDYPLTLGYNPEIPPEIPLGQTLLGEPYGISSTGLTRGGIILIGKPGSGKTNLFITIAMLIARIFGAKFWFFETNKFSFRNVFPLDDVIVITKDMLKWNRWKEPDGIDPVTYLSEQADKMADVHGFLAKGRQLNQKIIGDLSNEFGIPAGSPFRFKNSDIINRYHQTLKQTKSFDMRETCAKWLIRLAPLLRYKDNFEDSVTLDIEKLMNQNVIWELTNFPRAIQAELISDLINYKLILKMYRPELIETTNVNFIDEAQNLSAEDRANLTDGPVFVGMKTGREFKETFVIGDQAIKNVKPLVGQAHVVIVMQQSDFNIPFFLRSTTMNPDQANHLKQLPVGNAIVLKPMSPLIEINTSLNEIKVRRSDQEIESAMRHKVGDYYVPLPKAKIMPPFHGYKSNDQGMMMKKSTPDERRAYKEIIKIKAKHPLFGVGEVADHTEYQGTTVSKCMKIMVDMKLLEGPVSTPSRNGQGAWKKIHTVTEKGAQFAGIDWEAIRLRGKGGLESKVYARFIAKKIKQSGGTPKFEFPLTLDGLKKACDVADISDGIEAYEIDISPATARNNVFKNWQVGFDSTCIVAKKDPDKKKIQRELSDLDEKQYRYKVKHLAEFCHE